MNLDNYFKILNDTSLETKSLVNRNIDISNRIHYLLKQKFDGKQKLLAIRLGKTEAEVSKMINGLQNFTTKTIIKLEIAFGEQIMAVVTNEDVEECSVEYVNTCNHIKVKNLGISIGGQIREYDKDSEEIYEPESQQLFSVF